MSIFDPSMSFSPLDSWLLACCVAPLFIGAPIWASPSSGGTIGKAVTAFLAPLITTEKMVIISVFYLILVSNFSGLLPFVFSPTSHLAFNMSLSLALWGGMMVWYFKDNLNQMLSHLTPMGCPGALVPLMVVIELVSSLIRPLTLALRLMANVMAGHMIITLISKGVGAMPVLACLPLTVLLTGFLLFEFGVAVIQAFVFSSLMDLYWGESSPSHS